MRLPWIGQSATARSSNVSNLECINMYPEIVEGRQGKSVIGLYPTPGLKPVLTLSGSLGIRKLHTDSQGRLFAVHGFTVTEIFQDGTTAERGSLNTGVGPASMADNGQELIIVDGAFGYTFDYATSALNDIVDAEFLGGTHVGFLDGYFVYLPPAVGQQFAWSDLYAASFDATNVASAEGNPDVLVALLVAHREVWLFGRTTTEIWYSTGLTGGAGAEFARLQGALMEYGCLAPASPAAVGDTIYWLGQNTDGDGMVLQAVGATAHRISTHALEAQIQHYTSLADARGWGYQQEGHVQYILSFPSATAQGGVTWAYDATAGLWHKLSSHDSVSGADTGHPAHTHAFAFGRHYIGTLQSNMLFVLDGETYTDNNGPIVRIVTLPAVFNADTLEPVPHHRLQIDVETGVGVSGGVVPGTTPMLEMSYTDDGGKTFRGYRQASLGTHGDYRKKVVFRRLGSPEDRRYRLRFSDPCKLVILGALLR